MLIQRFAAVVVAALALLLTAAHRGRKCVDAWVPEDACAESQSAFRVNYFPFPSVLRCV